MKGRWGSKGWWGIIGGWVGNKDWWVGNGWVGVKATWLKSTDQLGNKSIHYGTRGSQVIPQLSTSLAQPRLTSEF